MFILCFILSLSNDSSDGTILAVLDVNQREIYISDCHVDIVHQLCMPSSLDLTEKLRNCLTDNLIKNNPSSPALGTPSSRCGPLYSVSERQKDETKAAKFEIKTHIFEIAQKAIKINMDLTCDQTIINKTINKKISKRLSLNNQSLLLSKSFDDFDSDENDSDALANTNEISESEKLLQFYSSLVCSENDIISLENPDLQIENSVLKEDINNKTNDKEINRPPPKPPKSLKPQINDSTNVMDSQSLLSHQLNEGLEDFSSYPTTPLKSSHFSLLKASSMSRSNIFTTSSVNSTSTAPLGALKTGHIKANSPIPLSQVQLIPTCDDLFILRLIKTQVYLNIFFNNIISLPTQFLDVFRIFAFARKLNMIHFLFFSQNLLFLFNHVAKNLSLNKVEQSVDQNYAM
jgi:hypothetical protein